MSVSATYADALFLAASEEDAVEAVRADLGAFVETLTDSPELGGALANPQVDTGAKKAVVGRLTEDAHPLVANFLQVLIDRRRIEDLPEIAAAFERRVGEAEGRLEVEAVTAVPLADDQRERILERISATTGRTATLTEVVDPEIVGGLVLRVGGVVVDGSVRHRLESLGRRLRSASVDAAATAS